MWYRNPSLAFSLWFAMLAYVQFGLLGCPDVVSMDGMALIEEHAQHAHPFFLLLPQ